MEGGGDEGEEGGVWRGGGGFEGYWVDDCRPFVFQIRRHLLAIVAPCLFPGQRAERRDFSTTEPMTIFSLSLLCSRVQRTVSPGQLEYSNL